MKALFKASTYKNLDANVLVPLVLFGLSILISSFVFIHQFVDSPPRRVGEIVSINDPQIIIQNARGQQTTVILTPITKKDFLIENLQPQMLIAVHGEFDAQKKLVASQIKIINHKRKALQ